MRGRNLPILSDDVSLLVYTFPPGTQPQHLEWSAVEPAPTDIL